jgi:hypothetical protein
MRLKANPEGIAACRLFCWLLCVALLGGCASTLQTDGRISAPAREGERLLASWAVQAGRVRSLQGLAKVKVKTPEQSSGGSQVIIASQPAQLRAETLSPFGTPLLLLATDGADLAVLVPAQNTYYFGRADARNIGRFTRIPARPGDLVDTLLYNVPIPAFEALQTWQLTDGGWLLKLSGSGRHQELVFDARRRLVALRYFYADQAIFTVAYSDFTDAEPPFPQRIDMNLNEYGIEASMQFSELELNTNPDHKLFSLSPPPGVAIYNLDQEVSTDGSVGGGG